VLNLKINTNNMDLALFCCQIIGTELYFLWI